MAASRTTLSRSKGACLVALLTIGTPLAAAAQNSVPLAVPFHQPARPQYIQPPYTPKPTRPMPTHRPGIINHGHGHAYPVYLDGSVVNRYLASPTPAPAPKPTRKPTPRPKNAPDQFESHSSTDANE